jgi:ATP-dependent DNA ligase/SAM-dependent methyltransferase
MNNSILKKRLAALKPIHTSVCGKHLNSLGANRNNKGIETEARFGKFQGSRFIPGVNKRQFDEIVAHYEQSGWTKTTSTDKVTSRSLNPRQNVRKIESSNGTKYQLKEKVLVVDVPPFYRLAKSKERTSVAFEDIFNETSNKGQYITVRKRITFTKGTVQVDLTQTDKNLQVEIEFKGNACKEIETIAEMIEDSQTKSMIFNEYKKLLGPRFAGPLPQTLTLESFKKRILTKQPYSVTEKADGERYLMMVDSKGGISLISRGMDIILLKDAGDKADFAGTVMDGELYKGKFYTFDILTVKGTSVQNKKLPERLSILYDVLMNMRVKMLKMKNFLVDNGKDIVEYPSRTPTGLKNIYDAAKAVWGRKVSFPYPLDGLIFTPTNDVYSSRGILKWKDENTIDFYYKGNKLHLAGFDGSGKQYMILPFEGYDGKGTFKTKSKTVVNQIFVDKEAPENVRKGLLSSPIPGPPGVGEFKFENNTFKLIRKRPDKQFPNGIEASNQVWESITNPLNIKELSMGPGAMRDFHSEIKAKLISKYASGKSVIDIGSGKGEDVGKYVKANSKPVVGFDIVKEEYPHPNYMTFHKMNSEVYTIKNYVKQKFDVININFAIHYFFKNRKTFESLVMNIHDNLKKGGIVMATVLDGKLIYQALKGKNKVNTNKYTMTKKYNNSTNFNNAKFKMLGQEVEMLVKGTKYFNKPISEFLFNFDKFMKIMEQMGFELVAKGNFQEFCSESEWCRRYMTEAEKEYSFKNIYFVLKKK